MSEIAESVPAAEANKINESAKLADLGEVKGAVVDEKGDGPKKLDHASEKTVCEVIGESKGDADVEPSQQIKRKSLDDGERQNDTKKKVKKDDDDDEGGDDEAPSEKTDENDDDAADKDADEPAEHGASDEPAS
jgi:hypothetical protein